MGVKRFTDLRAWQLANRLKLSIYEFTAKPPASNDRRFCDDSRSAIDSVTSNIAEGFGRYDHREFAQFLKIARGSLTETQSHVIDAFSRNYVSQAMFERMWKLSEEAMASVTALFDYVRTHPTPGKVSRPRRSPA
jgi:four helix bundle protein